jgi:hypothetical protein
MSSGPTVIVVVSLCCSLLAACAVPRTPPATIRQKKPPLGDFPVLHEAHASARACHPPAWREVLR